MLKKTGKYQLWQCCLPEWSCQKILTLISVLELIIPYNSYSQSQLSASAQACVCCHFEVCFYPVQIVFALLCMGWYHMQNSVSYFIICKAVKCIFIIIKGRQRNISAHILIHIDNSQTLPIASRITLSTLPHFRS